MITSHASFAELVVGALGTYLIHSTILTAVVWMLCRIWRDRPEIAAALWKVGLIGALVTTGLTLMLPQATWGPRMELFSPEAPPVAPVRPVLGGLIPPDVAMSEPLAWAELPPPSLSEDAVSASEPRRERVPWSVVILGAWAVLALAGLVRLGVVWWRLRRSMGSSRRLQSGPLVVYAKRWCEDAGLRGTVELRVVPGLSSPMALGLGRRGRICVPPRALEDLDDEQQRTMLAHELAHLLRRDPAWRLIGALVEVVFFFQPLHRVANRALAEASELVCDAWAARRTDSPLVLAQCLTEVAGWVASRRRLGVAPAMADVPSALARRITRLVDLPDDVRESAPRWIAGAMAVGLAAIVVLAPSVSSAHRRAHATRGTDGLGEVVVLGENFVALREAPGETLMVVRTGETDAAAAPEARADDTTSSKKDAKARRQARKSVAKERKAAKKRIDRVFRDSKKRGDVPTKREILEALGHARGREAEETWAEIRVENGVVIIRRGEGDRVIERRIERAPRGPRASKGSRPSRARRVPHASQNFAPPRPPAFAPDRHGRSALPPGYEKKLREYEAWTRARVYAHEREAHERARRALERSRRAIERSQKEVERSSREAERQTKDRTRRREAMLEQTERRLKAQQEALESRAREIERQLEAARRDLERARNVTPPRVD